jgi:hypothetical protein
MSRPSPGSHSPWQQIAKARALLMSDPAANRCGSPHHRSLSVITLRYAPRTLIVYYYLLLLRLDDKVTHSSPLRKKKTQRHAIFFCYISSKHDMTDDYI